MPRLQKEKTIKTTVLKTGAVFLAAYLLSLVLWIQVKDLYAHGMVVVASKVVAGIKGCRLEELLREGDIIQATFSPLGREAGMLVDIPVKTSSYTFNMPLTVAIMASLYPFVSKRRRAYLEAFLILLAVHMLYIVSLELNQLTAIFIDRGLEGPAGPAALLYEYIWSFTDNMIVRFEPFLLGCYLYLRYRTQGVWPPKAVS